MPVCVDIDLDIDIATFTVSPHEIAQINRQPYRGLQTSWPPELPHERQGIMYAGYPGCETRQLSRGAVSFGFLYGAELVSSVHVLKISSLIEREHLVPAFGNSIPPENYDFGGISGGPMLYNVLKNGLLVNALAGVVRAASRFGAAADRGQHREAAGVRRGSRRRRAY